MYILAVFSAIVKSKINVTKIFNFLRFFSFYRVDKAYTHCYNWHVTNCNIFVINKIAVKKL